MLNHLSFAEFDRVTRLAASALCALLALVCLWLAAQIVWTLLSPHDELTPAATSPGPIAAANTAAAVSVAKWHLFGNAQSLASQLARNAPATTLKLNLHGTLSLSDPKSGIAMIADDQGVEHSYRVGEELPGGAKLEEVYTDHVILAHEGASETLALPRPEQHAPSPLAPGVPALSGNPLAPKVGNGISPTVAPIYQAPIMAGGAVDWDKARAQVIQSPADLASRVKMVQENGKMIGVQLTNAGDTAMFASAGLRAGDIITAVNGTAVSDVGGIQQLFANAKGGTQLQVSVQRDGKPATLTVNLK